MKTPTYADVIAYANQVACIGGYSRAEMEAILKARFLDAEDPLQTLTAQGPAVLPTLREQKPLTGRLYLLLRRLGFLMVSLIVWLLGGEFDEADAVIRDVLDHLYGLETA